MKISHVTTRVLSTPADNPLVVGLPAPTDTREFVLLELGTDQGLVGIGLTFFGGALTPALRAAVDGLARLAVGEDPRQTEAIVAKCRRAAGSSGPGGIFSLALAAVDMACWDLAGKAAGRSVCALLGGLRDRAPTYASGALMRPHPVDYLAKAGPRLRDMGFRQMKMQCGSEPNIAASIERVRVMREAIGPDVDLMCDINQLWSVHHAIEVGRRALDRYPDGVWYVPLGAIAEPDLVAPTIAQELGLPDRGGRDPVARLADHLRSRHALLILDNFEQVTAAGECVRALVAASEHLTVVVTDGKE